MSDDFPLRLSRHCLEFFSRRVPAKGRPRKGQEWTVFSAIVLEERKESGGSESSLEVLAAGAGSKCLGESELSPEGDLVGDAHAEVLARRCFVRYLMSEVRKGIEEDSPRPPRILQWGGGSKRWRVRKGLRLHLFSTHPPCGDATIAPKKKRTCAEDASPPPSKIARLSSFDQHRTGAKCVAGEEVDALGRGGREYHTSLGAIRRKPGRGPPTRSLSCSDKLLRWGCLGIQGSMMSSLLEEDVLLHSVVVCGGGCDADSLRRALVERKKKAFVAGDGGELEVSAAPGAEFEFARSDGLSPSPLGVAFAAGGGGGGGKAEGDFEVCVDGRKQGCVRKHFGTRRARLRVCRRSMAEEFLELVGSCRENGKLPPHLEPLFGDGGKSVKYSDLKRLSDEYAERKASFLDAFPLWPRRDKEKMDGFQVDVEPKDSKAVKS